jgi:hypothetical protein
MTARHMTRLSRIEERAQSIRDDVFSAYLELLPCEDVVALLEIDTGLSEPSALRLESWLINMQPPIRSDIWRQAVKKVIDPHGVNDPKAIGDLIAEWRQLDEWQRRHPAERAETAL